MTQDDSEKQDELDDRELPDESDMDEDEDDPTVPCPKCRKPIHEDSEICHHCGQYIVVQQSNPGWVFWVATILVGLMMASIFGFMWLRY